MDRDNDRVKWHDKARATNAVCASFRSKRQQLQHALRSRCADGKATSDFAVNITRARLAAQAETLERAKEDAAAAKVQMETEVRDIMLGQGRGRKNGIS